MKQYLFLFSLCLTGFFASCSDNDDISPMESDATIVIEDSKASAVIYPQGFYVVNEDWFGHDNGSVNYFNNDGSITYRAYRAANADQTFGVSTCFATVYGDNMYFVSKQGNRLVVADAKSLKQKAVFTEIGGDGRSFLGINPDKGYIGTAQGISLFDIKTMTVGSALQGISGQVGNMCLLADRAFALVQGKGVYVIKTDDNTVETLIEGSFYCMTQSKDGNIWIATGAKLIKVDPYTLQTTDVDVSQAAIGSPWFAWHPGSLCASSKENVLYWTNTYSVVKYNIDTKELNKTFYTLGKDSEDKQLAFYAGALRVDPLTDKLILIVKRNGWGDSGSYNWLHQVDNTGMLEKTITVNGDNGLGSGWGTGDGRYFWFPTMPFFEDVNSPQILINQLIVKPNQRMAICLSDKVVDADNMSTAIVKHISYNESELVSYELKQDSLIISSSAKIGKTKFTLTANSNGKTVEKEVRVDIRE